MAEMLDFPQHSEQVIPYQAIKCSQFYYFFII